MLLRCKHDVACVRLKLQLILRLLSWACCSLRAVVSSSGDGVWNLPPAQALEVQKGNVRCFPSILLLVIENMESGRAVGLAQHSDACCR